MIAGYSGFCCFPDSHRYEKMRRPDPNFKYTGDADEKNIFDFQKYRKKLKEKEDVFIHFKVKDLYRSVKIK